MKIPQQLQFGRVVVVVVVVAVVAVIL